MIELPKEKYTGKIGEVVIGKDLKVGGENTFPFYTFEGDLPNEPRIALEVYDIEPRDWPQACLEPFKEVVSDPVAWAKKCVEYGADMICVQLIGTDPTAENKSAEEAAELCKKIAEAVNIPILVWGSGKIEKDAEVLKKVADATQGKNLVLAPVQENNYKTIGAVAIGYKNKISASAPMDVNLSKQLNILLSNLGVADDQIIIDPTAASLGYGIEYVYSIIERAKQAALTQNDVKLQMPIVVNLGKEAWKVKEVKIPESYEAKLGNIGDARERGILWEAISAMGLLIAGADIIIIRHPETLKLVRKITNKLLGKEIEKTALEKPKEEIKPTPEIPKVALPTDVSEVILKLTQEIEILKKRLDEQKPATVKIIIEGPAEVIIEKVGEEKSTVPFVEMPVKKKSVISLKEVIIDGVVEKFSYDYEARVEGQKVSCKFGTTGVCCRICAMGPCRISPKTDKGLCGATPDTIAARNLIRMIAVGSSLFTDYTRSAVKRVESEEIKTFAEEFGRHSGEPGFLKSVPKKIYNIWQKMDILPRGIDREIVELMHRTHMGVDQDFNNLLQCGLRVALSSGLGSTFIGSQVKEALSSPKQLSTFSLNFIEKDAFNIIVPVDSLEAFYQAAEETEIKALARQLGIPKIKIINLEDVISQEMAMMTGAIDVIVADETTPISALLIASCYHTRAFTLTSIDIAGVKKMDNASSILKKALANIQNRGAMNITENELEITSKLPTNTDKIKGIAIVLNCKGDYTETIKELIANDILVLHAGCGSLELAKSGLFNKSAVQFAGKNLAAFCEQENISPCIYVGTCMDISKVIVPMMSLQNISAIIPEWIGEKAIAQAFFMLGCGLPIILGKDFWVSGTKELVNLLYKDNPLGTRFIYKEDNIAQETLNLIKT
ncbi:MAG: acetyl-CoA decarbonylase/synthase complex subunit delta [bacterium]